MEMRRAMLALSVRRQRAGSGSDLRGLLGRGAARMEWWQQAENALSPIPHAVVGAVAAAAYMPARATADIDLAVAEAVATRLEDHLQARGWQRRSQLSMVGLQGTSWATAAGHPVDMIYLPGAWGETAIAAAQSNIIDGLPLLPLPYLTLMKLLASRLVDTGDLARMLGHQDEAALAAVRQVITAHGRPEDVADLEQIIALGRLEYEGSNLG
jgi:hypothetical protein